MKNFSLLLLLCILSQAVRAQTNFKAGFVITLKNDTIKGYIDYREWDNNPDNVKFKTTPTDARVQTLSPADIRVFGVNGLEFYESQTLRISMDEVNVQRLSTGADTSTKVVPLFLRVVQMGANITLFSYTDNLKTRYFIRDRSGTGISELIYKTYLNPDQSGTKLTKNTFQGQLISLAHTYGKDSPAFINNINQSDYTEREINKIVTAINGGNETAKQALTNRRNVQFFVGAALNAATLKYEGNTALAATGSTYTSSLFPRLAFGMDLFANPSVGRSFLRMEAAVTGSNFTNTGTDYASFGAGTATQTTKEITASIIPQVFYNFYNTDALKVFLGLGVTFNFSAINSKYNYQNSVSSIQRTDYSDLQGFWMNFPVKIGATINKKLEIFGCYAPSQAATQNNTYMGYITVMQLGINYRLSGNK